MAVLDPLLSPSTGEVQVSVGPSFSAHLRQLQEALGAGFTVTGMLAAPAEAARGCSVTVLGTPELPSGEILSHRRSPHEHVLLVGTGAPSGRRSDLEPPGSLQKLVDTVVACTRQGPLIQGRQA